MKTLQSEMIDKKIAVPPPEIKKQKKTNQKTYYKKPLPRWEIEELMGMNRTKFSRGPGGAMRGR